MFSCEYCAVFKNTYFEDHLRASASEIRHGKIRTYENGNEGNNELFYDRHLMVLLENKTHSVTLLCSPSLVLCNFKPYRLRILYLGWMSPSVILNLFLKFEKFEVNYFKLYYFEPRSQPAQSFCLRCLE